MRQVLAPCATLWWRRLGVGVAVPFEEWRLRLIRIGAQDNVTYYRAGRATARPSAPPRAIASATAALAARSFGAMSRTFIRAIAERSDVEGNCGIGLHDLNAYKEF